MSPRPGAGSGGSPSVPIPTECSVPEASQLFSDDLLQDVPIERQVDDDLSQFAVFVTQRPELA
jgi:hypothetical protein